MKKILQSTVVLVVITLIAGFALATVYEVTKDPIAAAEQAARDNAYRMVMPDASAFVSVSQTGADPAYPIQTDSGILINDCLAAVRDLAQAAPKAASASDAVTLPDGADTLADTGVPAPESVIGYVVNVTSPNGYGGNITIAVGILADGTIKGISVISQSETAGLGAVCAEDKFTNQFSGIKGFVEYVKTGKTQPNEIDAISGATITTKAVTEAVNAAVQHVIDIEGGKQS